MQDSSFYTMAAETESEMLDWIKVIKRVISPDNVSQRSTRTEGRLKSLGDFNFWLNSFEFPTLTME